MDQDALDALAALDTAFKSWVTGTYQPLLDSAKDAVAAAATANGGQLKGTVLLAVERNGAYRMERALLGAAADRAVLDVVNVSAGAAPTVMP